jgi:hypothetical protein
MLKTVIDYLGWRAHGCSSKLKRKLWEVNQVVSVEQILRHKKRFVKYTWMKKSKYLDIVFATRYPENINWQIWNR